MIAWKTEGTRLYQSLPEQLRQTLKPVEPLREPEKDRPVQKRTYFTWKEKRGE